MISFFNSIATKFAKTHQQIYAGLLERSQLQVQLALDVRREEELTDLLVEFNGAGIADLESEIDALFEKKSEFSDKIRDIDDALGKLNDIREDVIDYDTGAETGTSALLDLAIENLEYTVGSRLLYPEKMLGRPGHGSWPTDTHIYTAGNTSVQVATQYLGADYAIDLTVGGTGTLKTDYDNSQMVGDGLTIAFADVDEGSVVITGDTIDFTTGGGANTYSGTLRRGGTGLLSSWAYNNLATAGDIANAQADADSAMSTINSTETTLRANRAVLSSMMDRLAFLMDEKNTEKQELALQRLDEFEAAQKAIDARYDLVTNNLSLVSSTSLAYINNLFNTEEPTGAKQTIFGIIKDSY